MDYEWEATVEDVAALLPQRTKGEYGKSGEFRTDTTPTRDQVQTILDKSAANIASKLRLKDGEDICDNGPIGLANELHALRAAMIVERTYFANQLRTDQSPYKAMKEEYDKEIKEFLAAYEDNCGSGGGGLGGEEMPKGNFPKSKQWGRRRF